MTPALRLEWPPEGEVLNRHDGRLSARALLTLVRGAAPPGETVTVNGVPADRDGECFTALVPLGPGEQVVEARAGEARATARVVCDLYSRPRYRMSGDDNICWLVDLAAEPESFPSLFDHWYLAFWRRMHEQWGTNLHINIYYETVDQQFNLTQVPTKWRDQFEANAEWLHLSFHSRAHMPDRPYREASYDRMAQDFELTMGEIRRFAGEAVTSRETTIHWAEATREACQALRDRGVEMLIGIFYPLSGNFTTRYYLDPDTARHVDTREAWKDWGTDLTFVACDMVVDDQPAEAIVPLLERQAANPHTGERLEIIVHEPYFRPELGCHQPDVQQKVEATLRWVAERGYAPCFWSEGPTPLPPP